MGKDKFSRRGFLKSTAAGAVAAGTVASATSSAQEVSETPKIPAAPATEIQLDVNGKTHQLRVEDRWTLVEILRDHLRLTGTKIGCDRGECGACTVLLNGQPVYACSYLAVWADGAQVTTVEGLAKEGRLDPLQEAFIEHDGPQCGFCTPGQLMSSKALLSENPDPSSEEVRRALAGNLCRCSNYNHYVEAVLAAAKKDSHGS